MAHPIEVNSDVQLVIRPELSITVQVVGYELNKVDGLYHYHLQGEVSDGNTVATIQFVDVIEQFVIGKE